jgi:hypothetical protein
LRCGFKLEPVLRQSGAELAPGVVQRLVERAAGRAEPIGEASIGTSLSVSATSTARWCGVSDSAMAAHTAAISSELWASAEGDERRSASRAQPSSSSGISRAFQACLRTLTAASSRANL